MTPLMVLVAAAALGIDAGWQPLADGGHEYTIQIEPSIVGMLERGSDLVSEVPPQVNVRRFRVTIGSGALARIDGEPPASAAQPADAARGDSTERAAAAHPALPGGDEPPAGPSSPVDEAALSGPTVPAKFSDQGSDAQPLGERPAGYEGQQQVHAAEKPQLEPGPADAGQPWLPLLIAAVLLCCSLGTNFYLAWVAWDARARYRSAVSKLRTAAPA